ncbi:gluzincin family metallopeptidase [Streptomyces celluloflavus]|uniref:hypothetical protein n=1 Tax=Streptomyces celluloflavus TaxID=58344 RepID=UPI0036CDD2B3
MDVDPPADLEGKTGPDSKGKSRFLYENAADIMCRASRYWASIVPSGTSWHLDTNKVLKVHFDLQEGQGVNAHYDRKKGLVCYGQTVCGIRVYAGESPSLISHELGHAVLDAVRPDLFDAHMREIDAFHEAFGDISALLTGLQIDSLRNAVLAETDGQIHQSSQVSRFGEQAGWAYRQMLPYCVEMDCMRNLANCFTYQPISTLPLETPMAASISRNPHSFCRVFSGAFLRFLAGVYNENKRMDSEGLKKASEVAGEILMAGARTANITQAFFPEVAAHMIDADKAIYGGKYEESLKDAFERHEIPYTRETKPGPAPPGKRNLIAMWILGAKYGLAEDFAVLIPAESHSRRKMKRSAAAKEAESFVEDLFLRGKVEVGEMDQRGKARGMGPQGAHKTHQIIRDQKTGLLRFTRRYFD